VTGAGRPRRWPALVVLAVSLLLTAALCAWSVRNDLAERRALTEHRADAFAQALSGQLQSYIDTLPGLRVFGVLRQSPGDADFHQYVEAISLQRRYPGLALTFMADLVGAEQRDAYIANVRGDRSRSRAGHPDFDIHPPGARAQHMVLRHTYPQDGAAFGYDLFDPGQRYAAAVHQAINSGAYVATGPLLLARDRFAQGQPELTSVVVRAATYQGGLTPASAEARRAAALGVVGISFKTSQIVASVLPPELARGAHLRITDAQAQRDGQNALLFDSGWLGAQAAARAPDGPQLLRSITVADRRWDIALTERSDTWPLDSGSAWLMALGLALSASLALMTHTLVRGRELAERRVLDATAALTLEKRNLEQSEGRYRMLFANSLDAVLRTTPDGQVLAANPAACALFGRSEAELIRLGRRGLVDMSDSRLPALTALRASTGSAQGQLRMLKADGRSFESEVASNTYHDGDGALVASVIVRDVTEREAQAERQARLAAILDATPDFVASSDLLGRVLFLNHAGRRLLGLSDQHDLAGLRVQDCHPAWASRLVLEQGVPAALRDGNWTGRTAIATADGRALPVSQVILCHRNARGEATLLSTVARDLTALEQAQTERQALEARLGETQRLEAIGTLAGGVAHDFNNVLAVILGNVAITQQDLDRSHPAQHSLGLIHQAATRARTLVQQILTFSRRTPQQRSVQPLQPLVRDALSLLRATLPAGVRLHTDLADAPLPVLADAAQVHQVVLNLCMNAWQAMAGGAGAIHITLVPQRLPQDAPATATLAGLPAGGYALLQVRDDGAGMDEATRSHIFEPFFTTKPVGQGTGLGLAVVHGIVTGSGGAIEVDSAPGRGSSFMVWLPLADPAATGTPPAPTADQPATVLVPAAGQHSAAGASSGGGPSAVSRAGPSGGTAAPGTPRQVLYVDDDEVVGLTVQALLQRAGFQVHCVTEAAQALALVDAAPARFDLVVTDYNMPGMSGVMLAQALQQRAPALPVVITSGYVTEAMQAQAQAAGVRAVLFKEHTLEKLAALVNQVLAQAAPAADGAPA